MLFLKEQRLRSSFLLYLSSLEPEDLYKIYATECKTWAHYVELFMDKETMEE